VNEEAKMSNYLSYRDKGVMMMRSASVDPDRIELILMNEKEIKERNRVFDDKLFLYCCSEILIDRCHTPIIAVSHIV
jgi:hypothetical protein